MCDEKRCETCAFWTKNPKTDEFGSYGECPWYTIEYGMLRVVLDGEGDFRPFGSFGCPKHKEKPAEPFSVIPMAHNKRPMLVFGPTQEHRPVSVMIPDQLAQWLNELWAEREVGE